MKKCKLLVLGLLALMFCFITIGCDIPKQYTTATIFFQDNTSQFVDLEFSTKPPIIPPDKTELTKTFTHWYVIINSKEIPITDSNGEFLQLWTYNVDTIEIYSKFEEKGTSFVDANGENIGSTIFNTIPNNLPVIEQPGFIFKGWFYLKNNKEILLTNEKGEFLDVWKIEDKTITIYPKLDSIKYAISFSNEDILLSNSFSDIKFEDNLLPFPIVSKKGYSFLGWFTSLDSDATKITDGKGVFTSGNEIFNSSFLTNNYANDICLYAKFELNTYNLTFIFNNSEKTIFDKIPYGGTIVAKPSPSKSGYNFINWYQKGTSFIFDAETFVMPDEDITIEAKYSAIEYKINYVLIHGETNSSNNPISYTIESDTISLKPPTFAYGTFDGWYTDSNFATLQNSIVSGSTGIKTFYAKWLYAVYKIEYVLDNGINNKLNPATYTKEADFRFYPATKENFGFVGWYSDSEFKNKIESTFRLSEDIILYAKLIEGKTFNITYNLNGGVNSSSNLLTFTDVQPTFIFSEPTRAYAKFAGWYTTPSFTTKITEIKTGTVKNIDVYAKWHGYTTNITDFGTYRTVFDDMVLNLENADNASEYTLNIPKEILSIEIIGNQSIFTNFSISIEERKTDLTLTLNSLRYTSTKSFALDATTISSPSILNVVTVDNCVINGKTYAKSSSISADHGEVAIKANLIHFSGPGKLTVSGGNGTSSLWAGSNGANALSADIITFNGTGQYTFLGGLGGVGANALELLGRQGLIGSKGGNGAVAIASNGINCKDSVHLTVYGGSGGSGGKGGYGGNGSNGEKGANAWASAGKEDGKTGGGGEAGGRGGEGGAGGNGSYAITCSYLNTSANVSISLAVGTPGQGGNGGSGGYGGIGGDGGNCVKNHWLHGHVWGGRGGDGGDGGAGGAGGGNGTYPNKEINIAVDNYAIIKVAIPQASSKGSGGYGGRGGYGAHSASHSGRGNGAQGYNG